MDKLVVLLGQYAKNKPPLKRAVERLPALLAKDITVVDNTFSGAFSDNPPKEFPALVDYLIRKGYHHFGCFAENTDDTGLYANPSRVIFLMFNVPPNVNKTTINNVTAAFPFFKNRIITSITVSDNVDWIKHILTHRDTAYDCHGFEVDN